MGKVLLILTILLTSAALAQQKYYTFSELKGMEDQAGNTNLFYRLYYYSNNHGNIERENSIHHLNLKNDVDSLFLYDGGYSYTFAGYTFVSIIDYEFYGKDPSKYIYTHSDCSDPDCVEYITGFDNRGMNSLNAGYGNIEISNQDDSMLFVSSNNSILKSSDGGQSWNIDTLLLGKELISLDPLNDNTLFVQDHTGLFKTTDQGSSFSLVDTFQTDYKQFLYDKDKNHIYRIANSRGENFLSVSNNKGDANSWDKTFNDTNKFYISLDDSVSGSIYLADRNNIFYSSNYGNSFSLFKKLDHDIVGIYKKPDSNKLYVATKYKLLEIDGDSVKTLKSLPIDPKMFSYYPLSIGDKWVYENTYVNVDSGVFFAKQDTLIREVYGDTNLSNVNYYIIKDRYVLQNTVYVNYERIDSVSGQIFIYNPNGNFGNDESLLFDLASEAGDTNSVIIPFEEKKYSNVYIQDTTFAKWGSTNPRKVFKTISDNIIYSLTDSLGIDKFNDPFGSNSFDNGSEYTLLACNINGNIYGDTSIITGIKEKKIETPTKFSLFQNYPNPFNPITTIKYSIPTVVDANSLPTGRQVSSTTKVELKIYDILGRVVATLVNKEQRAGIYEVQFNASNLASGIYFYRLTYGSLNLVRKMVLLK